MARDNGSEAISRPPPFGCACCIRAGNRRNGRNLQISSEIVTKHDRVSGVCTSNARVCPRDQTGPSPIASLAFSDKPRPRRIVVFTKGGSYESEATHMTKTHQILIILGSITITIGQVASAQTKPGESRDRTRPDQSKNAEESMKKRL